MILAAIISLYSHCRWSQPLEPDLAAVAAAWPSLRAPLKAAIVAIANTATDKGGQ